MPLSLIFITFGGLYQMKEDHKNYVYCPFDNTHIIEASKIKKHFEKCKASNRK